MSGCVDRSKCETGMQKIRTPEPRLTDAFVLSYGGCHEFCPNEASSNLGSGCSTVVEHTPRYREVVGLNPAWRWAFFYSLSFSVLSLSISGVSLIRALREVVQPLIFP